MLAQHPGHDGRIGIEPAAPNTLAVPPHPERRLFQGHVETDRLTHGCSPLDAWARRPVVSPQLLPAGEQPPLPLWAASLRPEGERSRDYPMCENAAAGKIVRAGRRIGWGDGA